MARRRSLNRRRSKRSLNGTGILNDDSTIANEDDPQWWKRLRNRSISMRLSDPVDLDRITTSQLNPNSTIDDSDITGDWWKVLQKTNKDLVPKNSNKIKSTETEIHKIDITQNTSDSDTNDKLHKTKKRRINLRKIRRSLGTDHFSQALESSEPIIEPEPTPSKNALLARTSFQSVNDVPARKSRQRSKNDSLQSYNSNSSDTERIRKKRPTFFKKPREKKSHTAFDDVLEGDESIIDSSHNTDVEKSDDENIASASTSKKSHSTRLKQIDNNISLSRSKSLNLSNNDTTQTLNQSTKKNNSVKQNIKNNLSRAIVSNSINFEVKQNPTSESEESEKIISQSRSRFRMRNRKKKSINPFSNILNETDEKDIELSSSEKSIKQTDASSPIINKSFKGKSSSRLTLHLSPANSNTISDKIDESRVDPELPPSSDESTTSISEEFKPIDPNYRMGFSSSEASSASSKIIVSQDVSISKQILNDWNKSNSSDRNSNSKSSNTSEHHELSDNSVNRELKVNIEKLSPQYLNALNDSKILDKHSKTRLIKKIIEQSNEQKDNSLKYKINSTRKTVSRKLNESSDENNIQENEIQFNDKRRQSRKTPIKKSEASIEEKIDERLSGKRSQSVKISDNEKLQLVTRKSQRRSKNIVKSPEKSFTRRSNLEADDKSDSEIDVPRDPSAYELPDMNRSDSLVLSDSDKEKIYESPGSVSRSPMKHRNLSTTHIPTKNKNESSKILTKNISSIQPAESLPSTSGIQKKIPARKSIRNTVKSKPIESNGTKNQRKILNFLIPRSPGPIQHEPLPTQTEIRDFKEKLIALTAGRDQIKAVQKKIMDKELEEMRIALAKQTKINIKKIPTLKSLRKTSVDKQKNIDKAFIVNGKVYKPPKLPRPKRWATDRLYKYLWKILEPKFQLQTRIRSEKFVIDLSNVVTIVMKRKKYENYKDEVELLMKEMAKLKIIKTRNDFYNFCYDFLPYEFRAKVTPILLPGNKLTIPFDPDIVNLPILNE